MAVVRVGRKAAHADDEAFVQCRGDADRAAELVPDMRLALGDAVDLGFVQGMDLAAALCLLVQRQRDQGELGDDLVAKRAGGEFLQVTAQVPYHAASVTFQISQCLAHLPELFGLGIAADLRRQAPGEASVGLTQLHSDLLCQGHQLHPRPLVKPGIGRAGDILFHDSCVDRHALQTGLIDGPAFAPGRDGLGQQPLDTFLTDPPAPAGQGRRADGKLVLKEDLAGEVLVIGIFHTAGGDRLVRKSERVLEI